MFDDDVAGGGDHDAGAVGTDVTGVFGPRAACLAEALDGLLGVDAGALGDGELAAAVVELRREQSRLAAVVAEMTAAFEARQVHAGDGSRSATDWIAVRARVPRAQAGREVREARRLRAMPATRTAFRNGHINTAHVGVLCRLAGHPRAGRHFADGETNLVDHATTLRFDDWHQLVEHWLAGADPDGPEHKRQRDHDLRRFAVPVGLDGVGHPDGYLTPLATETITEALARIERDLFQADWAAAREVHGDDATIAHLARTPAQRRHDALVEMAVRATTAPADGKRPAPLVTVMVDYPTLAGRVCQLAGTGTVIAPGDITALLAQDGTLIERAVFDGPNRVRDISRARSFRGTLRRILEITHPRCDDPTCFVPAKDCQGDHITPWSQGGATSQDNGRMGCGFHNRLWYRHPHLRPPGRAPIRHLADDHGLGDKPADHTRDADPPTASPPSADSTVVPARHARRAPAARPRGPDITVTDSDTTHQIWLAA